MVRSTCVGLVVTFCILGGVMALAWGEEREAGRGGKSTRTLYTEIPPASTAKVSYEKDVKPILMENCTRCHGAKKHKAGLRLDSVAGILAGSKDAEVVTPGKSADSLLIHAVCGIDVEADKVMPPGKEDLLTKDEIGIVRAWIDQGAKADGQ